MAAESDPVTHDRVYRPIKAFAHEPALDGLRAFCLTAVLFYHARFEWAAGSFLGMPVFFVLSGFLIMWQLLPKLSSATTFGYANFMGRRFRRLMPGIWLTLGGAIVLAYLGLWHQEQLEALRSDVLASLAGLTNWYFITADRSYGDLFVAPSPLEHFWSLAIELQFYVTFPVVCIAVVSLIRQKATTTILKTLAAVITVGAVVSMAANWWLSRNVGIDRAYFGTDTRFSELAVGALLATLLAYRPQLWGFRKSKWAQIIGTVGLGVLMWVFVVANLRSETIYPFGFTGVAVLTALIMVASLERGPVNTLFSLAPLRRIGTLSFGIYLFHWPIFLLVSYESTGLSPAPLFVLRLVITYALAELSFRFYENPLRIGSMLRGTRFVAVGVVAIALLGALTLHPTDRTADPVDKPAPLLPPTSTTTLPEPELDVLLVGDEVASEFASGLNGHNRITYHSAVAPSCGYVVGGWVTMPTGVERDEERCWDALTTWQHQIDSAEVDAVIMVPTRRDMTDRLLTAQDKWLNIHSSRLQEFLHVELLSTFRTLLVNQNVAAIATMPVMNNQLSELPIAPQLNTENPEENALEILQFGALAELAPPTGFAENDPIRTETINTVMNNVATELDVGVLPLFDWVNEFPNGPLDLEWRPNGVGLSETAGEFLAEKFDVFIRDKLLVSPITLTQAVAPELAEVPPTPEFPPLRVAQLGREIRVAVVGDSVAAGIGEGIVRSDAAPNMRISFGTRYGCPIARGGYFRFMREVDEFSPDCEWNDRFANLVVQEQPHVVVISSGVWEVVDRRLPGDVEFRHLGSELLDNYFLAELVSAIDLVASQGANVVLLTQPPHEVGLRAGYSGLPESDPTRIYRLNELLYRAQSLRPDRVNVIDFAAHVRAVEGQQVDPQSRPDGLHFSEAQLTSFAHWLTPQLEDIATRFSP